MPATEWIAVTFVASSIVIGGITVGRRLASIVFPKPGSLDPPARLRSEVTFPIETFLLSEWIKEENQKRRLCACGCGKRIRVRPRHHAQGIPRYVQGHHPMAMTKEIERLHAQGFFTSGAVARKFGISLNTLRRLEGRLFAPVARHGKRGLWLFTASQVEDLRRALREKTRLGPKPELVGIVEVARRAGCAVQTIRRRLGRELPRGRKLTQGPRAWWGFTPEEAKQIAIWVRRHVRRTRRRTAKATK
jgi:hypothetical protein